MASYAREWSARDDRVLIALARRGAPIDEVALALVRTPEAVRQRARRLGWAAPAARAGARSGARWTPEEDLVLRAQVGSHPVGLARVLGRSDLAIAKRMHVLELHAARGRTPHRPLPAHSDASPGERALVARELTTPDGSRSVAVARRLGRSPGWVRRLAHEIGATEARERAA